MNLTLICKGGVNTGLGHLHRALSFIHGAAGLVSFNLVAIIEPGLESLFRKHPGATLIYSDQDLEQALSSVKDEHNICLIDMLTLGADQCRMLRARYRRIYSLSPVFSDLSIIDVVFTRFSGHSYPPHIKVYSGLEYAIFNTNCQPISDEDYRRTIAEEHLTIAVSMGGTDAPNKTLMILKALARVKFDLTIWVLLGEGYGHSYQELVDTIKKDSHHEIVLVKSNRSMWRILSHCAVAIFAGGLTSFEAIYAGLPTLNILDNESQKDLVPKELVDCGATQFIGVIGPESLDLLIRYINSFHVDRELLSAMRHNTNNLLDGSGAMRTAQMVIDELIQMKTAE